MLCVHLCIHLRVNIVTGDTLAVLYPVITSQLLIQCFYCISLELLNELNKKIIKFTCRYRGYCVPVNVLFVLWIIK